MINKTYYITHKRISKNSISYRISVNNKSKGMFRTLNSLYSDYTIGNIILAYPKGNSRIFQKGSLTIEELKDMLDRLPVWNT